MSQSTTIELLSSLKDTQYEHVLFEVFSLKDIEHKDFPIDPAILSQVEENLKQKGEKYLKTLTFAFGGKYTKKITCFFPDKNTLMDDRSQLFRDLETGSVFVPSRDAVQAYEAIKLATYKYQVYLSKKKNFQYALITSLEEQKEIETKKPLYDAIIEARDIINMPSSDANPENLVKHILSHSWIHFDIQVFDAKELKKLGCNLILAVGAGSENHPYIVILTPKNPIKGEKYALIGKGVTFDAGGIQIKPDTAMLDMKCDMSGAAAVLGVARYLDSLPNLPVDLTIAVGLTENMTGGGAYKPLDIYKAYNGMTVEIHHTDAEGRLVLADVMAYVEKNHKVDHMITIATLTGACVYALGHDIAGIMGDDEIVIRQLVDNSSPYEQVWRLPMNEKFKKSLKAEIADLKNISKSEKAGSSIGGAFLSYFQGKAKLTHIDIAGPAYRETTFGYMPKGGTGWGVKVLSELLLALQEEKKVTK